MSPHLHSGSFNMIEQHQATLKGLHIVGQDDTIDFQYENGTTQWPKSTSGFTPINGPNIGPALATVSNPNFSARPPRSSQVSSYSSSFGDTSFMMLETENSLAEKDCAGEARQVISEAGTAESVRLVPPDQNSRSLNSSEHLPATPAAGSFSDYSNSHLSRPKKTWIQLIDEVFDSRPPGTALTVREVCNEIMHKYSSDRTHSSVSNSVSATMSMKIRFQRTSVKAGYPPNTWTRLSPPGPDKDRNVVFKKPRKSATAPTFVDGASDAAASNAESIQMDVAPDSPGTENTKPDFHYIPLTADSSKDELAWGIHRLRRILAGYDNDFIPKLNSCYTSMRQYDMPEDAVARTKYVEAQRPRFAGTGSLGQTGPFVHPPKPEDVLELHRCRQAAKVEPGESAELLADKEMHPTKCAWELSGDELVIKDVVNGMEARYVPLPAEEVPTFGPHEFEIIALPGDRDSFLAHEQVESEKEARGLVQRANRMIKQELQSFGQPTTQAILRSLCWKMHYEYRSVANLDEDSDHDVIMVSAGDDGHA